MADALDITPAETAAAIADGSATIVDVREPHEREAGYIDGSVHIPLADLSGAAEKVPAGSPVIFYCLAGVRSEMAAQAFKNAGYDARTMTGGIGAWDAEGRPLAPEGGRVVGH